MTRSMGTCLPGSTWVRLLRSEAVTQTSTCDARARRSRRTSRGCSTSSERVATFSIMATIYEEKHYSAGVTDAFTYPGFVPAYIRPLFCRGVGPFRWAALSGEPADIEAIDRELLELFPDDALLRRWLELAPGRVEFQGLPARICWLGYGDRARAGLAINELVRSGRVRAPVAIGRDHLDAGSVASPYRETEAMRDGSDAIADWPILNALLNVAAGATWVSVHHGGGVGIGNSIHAGMVVGRRRHGIRGREARASAHDRPGHGSDASRRRRLRGGARRRAARRARPPVGSGAGHHRVSTVGAEPARSLLIRDLAQVVTPGGTRAPLRGHELGAVDVIETAYVLCENGRVSACRRDARSRADPGRRRRARRAGALGDTGARGLPHARVLRR